MAAYDEEEFWDEVDEDELDELDEDEREDTEEFIEEVFEVGDLIGDDYTGPTCIVTIAFGAEEYSIKIPAQYVPDILDLGSEYDIEIDIETT